MSNTHTTINNMSQEDNHDDDDNEDHNDDDAAFWEAAGIFSAMNAAYEQINVLGLIGLDGANLGKKKTKRQRTMKSYYTEGDRDKSVFTLVYLEPYNNPQGDDIPLLDPTSREGKTFQKMFRVPYLLFLNIHHHINNNNNNNKGKRDCCRKAQIDCRLLVLGSLRYLGIGTTFDALEEVTHVSGTSHQNFFLNEFLSWGVTVAREIIFLLRNDDKYDAVEEVYWVQGLPGCVGSIDCVHLSWDRCRSGLLGECVGKEGKPTLTFEVVVTHNHRIQSVSGYCHGAQNDKTISRHDWAVNKLRTPGLYLSQTVFLLKTNDTGDKEVHTGVYYNCDGGYCMWTCLMPPYKEYMPATNKEGWSKRVESLRKDVECMFGSLKKQFLAIKNPIWFADAKDV